MRQHAQIGDTVLASCNKGKEPLLVMERGDGVSDDPNLRCRYSYRLESLLNGYPYGWRCGCDIQQIIPRVVNFQEEL